MYPKNGLFLRVFFNGKESCIWRIGKNVGGIPGVLCGLIEFNGGVDLADEEWSTIVRAIVNAYSNYCCCC